MPSRAAQVEPSMEMGGRAGGHHADPTVPLLQCARLPCAQPTTMSPPSDTSSHLCLVRALGRGEYGGNLGRGAPRKEGLLQEEGFWGPMGWCQGCHPSSEPL